MRDRIIDRSYGVERNTAEIAVDSKIVNGGVHGMRQTVTDDTLISYGSNIGSYGYATSASYGGLETYDDSFQHGICDGVVVAKDVAGGPVGQIAY